MNLERSKNPDEKRNLQDSPHCGAGSVVNAVLHAMMVKVARIGVMSQGL
jgi:hypothetical protein